jgi:hypothetical protein
MDFPHCGFQELSVKPQGDWKVRIHHRALLTPFLPFQFNMLAWRRRAMDLTVVETVNACPFSFWNWKRTRYVWFGCRRCMRYVKREKKTNCEEVCGLQKEEV